jgi:hypothetical protein
VASENAPAAGGSYGDGTVGEDEPAAFDTSVAHQARMYDYLLGGKDNYAADRVAAEAALRVYPEMAFTARANRAFLGRVVRYLAGEAGIRQFLDIGTGIPAAGNTHEVAQAVAPDCRIVYVDHDPVVLAHARALLTSGDHGATDYIDADLRDTRAILDQAAHTLDFSRPVAVMLLSILHAIGDDDDPFGIVAKLVDAVPPGSYLALSHMGSDILGQTGPELRDVGRRLSHQQYSYRSHSEISRFFDGMDLVEPGLVQVEKWRPTGQIQSGDQSALWGAVARKR